MGVSKSDRENAESISQIADSMAIVRSPKPPASLFQPARRSLFRHDAVKFPNFSLKIPGVADDKATVFSSTTTPYFCTLFIILGLLLVAKRNLRAGWRRPRVSPEALESYRECLAQIHCPLEWTPPGLNRQPSLLDDLLQ